MTTPTVQKAPTLREKLSELSKTIEINYGDTITKKELSDLFGLESPLAGGEVALPEFKRALDAYSWAFFGCIDMFRELLHLNRKMHLRAKGREGIYEIIRPDQHVNIAFGNLSRQITKEFAKCHSILDSTETKLLSQTEQTALSAAQIRASTLQDMFTKQTARQKMLTKLPKK